MKNLSHLPNKITSLEQLVPYYRDLEQFVRYNIVNNEITIDVLNEALLRLDSYFKRGKVLNQGYIAITLYSEYDRYIAKEKRFSHNGNLDKIDESPYVIEDKIEMELLYDELDVKLSKLTWYEKEILKYSHTMKLAQLSRETKISYWSLRNSLANINKKLKE